MKQRTLYLLAGFVAGAVCVWMVGRAPSNRLAGVAAASMRQPARVQHAGATVDERLASTESSITTFQPERNIQGQDRLRSHRMSRVRRFVVPLPGFPPTLKTPPPTVGFGPLAATGIRYISYGGASPIWSAPLGPRPPGAAQSGPAPIPTAKFTTGYSGSGAIQYPTVLLTADVPIVGILDANAFGPNRTVAGILSDGSVIYGQSAGSENVVTHNNDGTIDQLADPGSLALSPINSPAADFAESGTIPHSAVQSDALAALVDPFAFDPPASVTFGGALVLADESMSSVVINAVPAGSSTHRHGSADDGTVDLAPGPPLMISRDVSDGPPTGDPSSGRGFETPIRTSILSTEHTVSLVRPMAVAPEPTTLGLLLVAMSVVVRRRR